MRIIDDRDTYRVIIYNRVLPFVYNVHGRTDTFILQEDRFGPHKAHHIAIYLQN